MLVFVSVFKYSTNKVSEAGLYVSSLFILKASCAPEYSEISFLLCSSSV